MIIRLATLQDIPEIMTVIREVVPLMIASGNLQWNDDYPNVAVFENDVALNRLWVADFDGAIAGVAALTTDAEPEYEQAGIDITAAAVVTHRLAVSTRFAGRGIAKALLNKAEEVAIQKGIKFLRTDTNSNNKATQKLFPTLGYIYKGNITLALRPGLNFYCYEKELFL